MVSVVVKFTFKHITLIKEIAVIDMDIQTIYDALELTYGVGEITLLAVYTLHQTFMENIHKD